MDKTKPTVIEASTSYGIFQLFRDIVHLMVEKPLPLVIGDEIKNVLVSYLTLLKPPIGNLDLMIWEIKDSLDEQIRILNDTSSKKYRRERISSTYTILLVRQKQLFLEAYKEYCNKENYHPQIPGW